VEDDETWLEAPATDDVAVASSSCYNSGNDNEIHGGEGINEIHSVDSSYLPPEEESSTISSNLIALEGALDDNVFTESTVDLGGSNEPAFNQLPEAMSLFEPPPSIEIRPHSILYSIDEDASSDNDSSYSSENEMSLYFPPKDMTTGVQRFVDMNSREEVTEHEDRSSFDEEASPPPGPRPRKSSIVLPGMKKPSSEGRRRSVHFQPEVLLQQVVVEGDLDEVKDVLRSGGISDVNRMSPIGLTALHQAALDGNLDCANTLVLNGADVNTQDCEGWTPLHAAAIEGHVQFVRFLLLANADPNIRNDDNETAYDIASQKIVKKMLLSALNGTFLDQFSDPHYIAESDVEDGDAEESDGYDDDNESNGDDESGDLKLRMKSVRSLVSERRKEKADRNSAVEGPSEQTVSLHGEDQSSVDVFHEDVPEERQRFHSSSVSSLDSFDIAIENKEDDGGCLGQTKGTISNITYELSEEDQGISTMDGSSDSNTQQATLHPTEYHLDEDLQVGSLDYMFQDAVLSGDIEALVKLIKVKDRISVNRINKGTKVSALHHAILEEKFTMVQHLVRDFRSDLHVQDEDGYSPLHAASAIGNIQIAQFLLDHGAKPSMLNNQCEFPVDVAQDDTMEQLLKRAMLGPPVGNVHGLP
jgi:ankyrin repeat protein